MNILIVEIIGHFSLLLVYGAVLVHVIFNRGRLRRNLRSSRVLYWLTVGYCVVFGAFNGFRMVFLLTNGLTPSAFPLVDLLSEYPSAIAQSLIIGYLIMNRITIERPSQPLRILIVGAHPDDLEIAAGATLAKLHDSGHTIHGLVMTRGGKGGDERVRPVAARRGASFLGLDDLKQCDFIDTRLRENEFELVQVIEREIQDFKPDLIFTHSSHDIHQDHQAVYEATVRAGRNHPSILCYESPSVTQDFQPGLFFDASDYVDIKIEAINMHWDQRGKFYVNEDQVRGKMAFRGGQARMEYAEGFEVVRMSFNMIVGQK